MIVLLRGQKVKHFSRKAKDFGPKTGGYGPARPAAPARAALPLPSGPLYLKAKTKYN